LDGLLVHPLRGRTLRNGFRALRCLAARIEVFTDHGHGTVGTKSSTLVGVNGERRLCIMRGSAPKNSACCGASGAEQGSPEGMRIRHR